jgi:transcription elongation factor GreA
MNNYLTAEGLEKLKKELDYLEKVKRKEVSETLVHTISFGDISENAAYDQAKEAQGFLEGRILELKEILSNVKLIGKSRMGNVQIGSTVLLCSAGGKEQFQIVGPEEADVLNGKISHVSPLGGVVLGKSKGDKFVIKTPGGAVEYKILDIK